MRHGRLITTVLAALAVMAIAPAWAAAATSSFTDDDFVGGTAVSTAVIAPGSVRLNAPIVPETFDTGMPAGWTATQWTTGVGGTTFNPLGVLNADGVHVENVPMYAPGQVLEFRAAFSGAARQHVGFGDTFAAAPWAMISTAGGDGLYMRTSVTPGDDHVDRISTSIPGFDATVMHTYRIEWSASDVKYFIDDAPQPVVTHNVAIASQMRPVISDFDADMSVVSVDSLGQMAFPVSGTFESRAFDARDPAAQWGTLTAVTDPLSAAGVTIETRTSNDATNWSSYQTPGAGGAIQSPSGRYLQYRATLARTAGATPRLDKVTVAYEDNTGPTTTLDPVQVSGTTATITFSSAAADLATFECSLDGAAFAACTSPKDLTGLVPGSHTVSVRGVDTFGNQGSETPRTFTVDSPVVSGGGGGGGGGGTTTTTTTQPSAGSSTADKTKPNVSVVAKSLKVSKTGTVSFRVGCPKNETSCKIQLQLKNGKKIAAKKTVTVKGGKTVTLTLQLSKATRQLMSKHSTLKVSTVVTATDAAGNRKTTTKQLTLRRAAG